jgi:hypothetical protein
VRDTGAVMELKPASEMSTSDGMRTGEAATGAVAANPAQGPPPAAEGQEPVAGRMTEGPPGEARERARRRRCRLRRGARASHGGGRRRRGGGGHVPQLTGPVKHMHSTNSNDSTVIM